MKFNEKLIELRKKEGLSQEELGYKLNVTRQTVSKWELGQTTPEMDKLLELSKIFNISVDELINESEIQTNQNSENQNAENQNTENQDTKIEDQPIVEKDIKNTREKNVKIIIIVALIVVVVLIVIKLCTEASLFNKATDTIEQEVEVQESIIEKIFGLFDKTLENVNDAEDEMDVDSFNGPMEVLQITGNATTVLDEVIKSNKTQDRKITVKYNEIETQDTEEISNLKTQLDQFGSYDISFEYDEKGYINEAIIEKL